MSSQIIFATSDLYIKRFCYPLCRKDSTSNQVDRRILIKLWIYLKKKTIIPKDIHKRKL